MMKVLSVEHGGGGGVIRMRTRSVILTYGVLTTQSCARACFDVLYSVHLFHVNYTKIVQAFDQLFRQLVISQFVNSIVRIPRRF